MRRAIYLLVAGLLISACGGADASTTDEAAGDAAAAATTESVFLSEDTIHEISIEFDDDDYAEMLDAYAADSSKEWISATVTIDGVNYEDAGIRLKGNSSLFGLTGGQQQGPSGSADADTPEALPWLIRLDKYVDGQNHDGIYDLVVRSNNSTTALNEAVALDLLEAADLASQESVYAAFSVNGSDTVLRLVMELPDDEWMEATFGDDGSLYKAESTGNWSYRGDDPDAYDEVFDLEAGDDEDLSHLTAFLDFLNNADDETFYAELDDWLDTDSFATYLAIQELIANEDDINGRGNNAYLYYDPDAEQFTVVPWDHNLAFSGIGGDMMPGGEVAPGDGVIPGDRPNPGAGLAPGGDTGFEDIALQTDIETAQPAPGGGDPREQRENRPGADMGLATSNVLVDRFLADDEYEALYESELERLTAELYESGTAAEILEKWVTLLENEAGDLVSSATIESEAAAISRFFE